MAAGILPINITDDDIEIAIGGTLFGGWTNASVTRSVSEMTGSFNFTLHDPQMLLFGGSWYSAFRAAAVPGVPVEVWVSGEKFLTGFIDTRNASKAAQSHDVQVSGRGKSRNAIDSSHTGKNEYKNQKPKQIIKDILKPFGQTVTERALDAATTIPFFRNYPGDYASDLVVESCRMQGLTCNEDKNGNLVIRGKDNGPAAGALVQGENLLTWSVNISDQDKNSKYSGKAQGNPDANRRGKTNNQASAEVVDVTQLGMRPLVVMGESVMDDKAVRKRTQHEAAVRAGHALKISCTLYGYRGSSGKIWEPDTLAPVYIPDENVADKLLVESVSFAKGPGGSITSLQLTRKEAYEAKTTNGKGQKAKGATSSGKAPGQIILTGPNLL